MTTLANPPNLILTDNALAVAISLLRRAGHHLLERSHDFFICHALIYVPETSAEVEIARNLRAYVRGVLRRDNQGHSSIAVMECTLPRDIAEKVEHNNDHAMLMRAAWCDKMAYDLETTGGLP